VGEFLADHLSWGPRFNILPGHHLRLTLDTSSDPSPHQLLALTDALVRGLSDRGYSNIVIIHAGRGSTTVELAVEREKAEIEKTKAETKKLLAEASMLKLKVRVTAVSALYFAALGFGIDIAKLPGAASHTVLSMANLPSAVGQTVLDIAKEHGASFCRIEVGEDLIEYEIPPLEHETKITNYFMHFRDHFALDGSKLSDEELSNIEIKDGPNITNIEGVRLPINIIQNSVTVVHGVIREADSISPKIIVEGKVYSLNGLIEPLPLKEGANVIAEMLVDASGAFYPKRFQVNS
jgi:hypothetical protein